MCISGFVNKVMKMDFVLMKVKVSLPEMMKILNF